MSEPLWAAILTVAVWPAGIVVLVIAALLLASRDQQATVFEGAG